MPPDSARITGGRRGNALPPLMTFTHACFIFAASCLFTASLLSLWDLYCARRARREYITRLFNAATRSLLGD